MIQRSGPRPYGYGFSSFQSSSANQSGVIVQTIADSKLWPSEIDLKNFVPSGDLDLSEKSRLNQNDYGGRASQREIVIDGTRVTVCVLLLEVLWDLAGSIILEEAKIFRPDAIIMTGAGNTAGEGVGQFEFAALNRAMALNGYYSNGQSASENLPQIPESESCANVLDPSTPGVDLVLPMKWHAQKLAKLTSPLARSIQINGRTEEFDMTAATSERYSNTYLCNNTSYIVLAAVKGLPTALAGGEIQFPLLKNLQGVKLAGFIHIPDLESFAANTILGWAKVLAQVMILVE